LKESPLIVPEWPAPASIHAYSTTRCGGVSKGCYADLNLGARTGDALTTVNENRKRLRSVAKLPSEPVWLNQVHGKRVIEASASSGTPVEADGAVTGCVDIVCAVLTADCLPVLLCKWDGTRVGAAHVGWRGLVAGVVEAAVTALGAEHGQIIAWLGPCIGQTAFEVGSEVPEALLAFDPGCDAAIRPGRGGRWHVDLREATRRRLTLAGVRDVSASDECTFSDPGRFYSYRRDGECGRMVTLIWLENSPPRVTRRPTHRH
jgi:YfiH family protein